MDLKDKLTAGLIGLLVLGMLALILDVAWQRRLYAKERLDLQNQLAEKSKTEEIKDGLYTKLVVQTNDLNAALNASDSQVKELEQQVKQDKEDLYNVTQVGINWEKSYEKLAKAQQSDGGVTQTDGGVVARARVDFDAEFPDVGVGCKGYTLTNPPEQDVNVWQLQPLKLTLALSQDKTKAWHAYVTSNLPGIKPDIGVTEVNPYLLEEKWYEKLAVRGDLGLGTTSGGLGLLLGVGATYQIGKFEVGPAAWFTASDRVDKYLGVMGAWHPFMRGP